MSCRFCIILLSSPQYNIAKLFLISYKYFMENIEPFDDKDILKESNEGVSAFIDSLGENSIYKQIFLEELFKILLNRKG